MDTTLAKRMVARADKDALSEDHPMRENAAKFDAAAKGFYSEQPTCDVKTFMGAYARARRSWCDYTGESLV